MADIGLDGRLLKVLRLRELVGIDFRTSSVQRDLDAERVSTIVDFQTRRHAAGDGLFFSGVIIVWEYPHAPGELLVLDGQHRLEAMKRLAVLSPDFRVVVEVLRSPPGLTIETAFQLINEGVPVPEYIKDASASATRRPVLDRLGVLFKRRFGAFLSKSTHPNLANVNLTQFLDRVHKSAIIGQFHNGDDLMDYVIWNNALLRRDGKVSKAADKKKAEKGLNDALYLREDPDYEWLDDLPALKRHRESRDLLA
jgi:hypothetical protein